MRRPASLRPVALAALASAQVCLVSAMLGGCDDGIPGALIPKDSGSFDVARPDGAGGDGSVDGGADAPFVPDASICSPKTTWAAGTLVPNVSTAQADRFGSVTPDELTAMAMLGVPVTSVCTTRKMLDLLELEPVAPNCGALPASAEGRTSPLEAG